MTDWRRRDQDPPPEDGTPFLAWTAITEAPDQAEPAGASSVHEPQLEAGTDAAA
jgi:hypothetical protein